MLLSVALTHRVALLKCWADDKASEASGESATALFAGRQKPVAGHYIIFVNTETVVSDAEMFWSLTMIGTLIANDRRTDQLRSTAAKESDRGAGLPGDDVRSFPQLSIVLRGVMVVHNIGAPAGWRRLLQSLISFFGAEVVISDPSRASKPHRDKISSDLARCLFVVKNVVCTSELHFQAFWAEV